MGGALRVCFSGEPQCSGVRPCGGCWTYIKERIVPRAMVQAGEPFDTDPELALRFMNGLGLAWDEHAKVLDEAAEKQLSLQAAALAKAPVVAALSTIDTFREAFERSLVGASTAEREMIRENVITGKIEGWSELGEEERGVIREILQCDTPSAPAPAPEATPAKASTLPAPEVEAEVPEDTMKEKEEEKVTRVKVSEEKEASAALSRETEEAAPHNGAVNEQR